MELALLSRAMGRKALRLALYPMFGLSVLGFLSLAGTVDWRVLP